MQITKIDFHKLDHSKKRRRNEHKLLSFTKSKSKSTLPKAERSGKERISIEMMSEKPRTEKKAIISPHILSQFDTDKFIPLVN